MGPRASPRALALLPRAHCPSPPPAPPHRPLLQPPTTAVGEDLMQGKPGRAPPKNHQRRHTVRPQVIISAYPDLPCVSSTSSAPAALNAPSRSGRDLPTPPCPGSCSTLHQCCPRPQPLEASETPESCPLLPESV